MNELWLLDFTGVDPKKNEQVHAQGKLTCIKTATKGYFSIDLERYPTRQDLAIKTKLVMTIMDEEDEERDSFYLQSLCIAYEQGYGHGVNGEERKNPYLSNTQNHWCWEYGKSLGTNTREMQYKELSNQFSEQA